MFNYVDPFDNDKDPLFDDYEQSLEPDAICKEYCKFYKSPEYLNGDRTLCDNCPLDEL